VVTGWKQAKYARAEKSYIEQREGIYRVGDTRMSFDSIVYAFLEGHTQVFSPMLPRFMARQPGSCLLLTCFDHGGADTETK
jgi:hypothetical protein